jgi:outer membrane cobalamin receptor
MKERQFVSACLAISLFLLPSLAMAIGTREDQSEDIFNLGEVTVTTSALNTIESGQSVHVITEDEINKSSARTLDEALVLLPDVNVKVGSEGVPRVEIRGAKGKDILVLLNGVPINSAFDGQFDPSTIPVDSIAKIKVTVGASSVLYAQGALGGVIDIITKKGNQGFKGTAGFEAGDGTPYLAKASLSAGKGKFDFFTSASAFRRDRFPLAEPFTSSIYEEAGYRKNSDNTRNNVFMSLGFTPSDTWHFSLTGNYVEGGYGKPASAINNKFDPYALQAQFARVDNYEGILGQLTAEYTPSERFDIRSKVFYNRMAQDNNRYDNEDYDSFDDPFVANSYRLRNTGTKTGASIQPTYDFGRWGSLTFDLSGEQDAWDATGDVKPGGGTTGAAGGHGVGSGSAPYVLFPVSDHYDLSVYSVAVEYKVSLLKNLGLGVGYGNLWQVRDDQNLANYRISASLYYDVFQGTRLKAAFMRNVRFPTISELYLRPTWNTGLSEERTMSYQLGLEQKLPWRSQFEINGFYNDVRDFIGLKLLQLTPQEAYQPHNVNIPHIRFYGFEASLSTSFLKRLKMRLAYTRNNSVNLSGPTWADNNQPLQYVPRDKATFSARYDFDWGLTPFLSVVYVGDSVVYSKQQYVTVLKSYMTPYIVANLKLSQRLFRDKLTVYAGADNILNWNYEDAYGIPRAGRYIFAGFDYHF